MENCKFAKYKPNKNGLNLHEYKVGSSRYRICPSFCSGTMTRMWNGSFLVFRRLRQDVQRFHADTDIMADQFSAVTHKQDGRTAANDFR